MNGPHIASGMYNQQGHLHHAGQPGMHHPPQMGHHPPGMHGQGMHPGMQGHGMHGHHH